MFKNWQKAQKEAELHVNKCVELAGCNPVSFNYFFS